MDTHDPMFPLILLKNNVLFLFCLCDFLGTAGTELLTLINTTGERRQKLTCSIIHCSQ